MENISQHCKPRGEEGRKILEYMNEHHRPVTEWALSNLPSIEPKKILDIGCGGGMLIGLLGTIYPHSVIDGVDFSSESIATTKNTCQSFMVTNRLTVTLASVSDLPFDEGTFDLITAMETYFFWPDLKNDILETFRVLSPGGTLMIGSEAYPHPDFEERNKECKLRGLKLVTNKEMVKIMESTGLSVKVVTLVKDNWVTFIGEKSL